MTNPANRATRQTGNEDTEDVSTLTDVARLAGVSTMTVSRAINDSGYVSPEARARVNRAIAELGYMPNVLARQLRSKRTKTLALVLTDIANPFFTTIARGVEDAARAQGYAVMFCNTDESEAQEIEYVRVLIQRQVDGVLLVPATDSSASLQLLHKHGLPVVVLDRRLRSGGVDEVRTDSEAGAHVAVRHLLDLGHRRIAVLTGPEAVSTAADRVAGYRRAMAEEGLEPDGELVIFGGYNETSGYEMTRRILDVRPQPTALFAANNFIAFGAIRALREAGMSTPKDMSIAVFDDLPPGWVFDPFLTVVSQPAYEIGKQAAELMLERLAGKAPAEPRTIVLPSELITRRSTAPLRREAAA
jgi:LacI family transcriptional regulator